MKTCGLKFEVKVYAHNHCQILWLHNIVGEGDDCCILEYLDLKLRAELCVSSVNQLVRFRKLVSLGLDRTNHAECVNNVWNYGYLFGIMEENFHSFTLEVVVFLKLCA